VVNEYLRPLRCRRAELVADPGYLDDVLARGNARANQVADETLDQVRQVMDMTYKRPR
jgi:tryptophanyl-tRNA synthetase